MKCCRCDQEIKPGEVYLIPDKMFFKNTDVRHTKCPSELETLRSENALLSERVKELESLVDEREEFLKKKIFYLEKELNDTLREMGHVLDVNAGYSCKIGTLAKELSALKESKTVYVRRCK